MKIGLARYPYANTSLRGGDNILFDRIQHVLEMHGHHVTNISYKRPASSLLSHLPRLIKKLALWLVDLFIPPIFSYQLKKISNSYDLIIADSSVVTYAGNLNIIPIVNIDYHAYAEATGRYLPLHSRIKLFSAKFFQKLGAKHYPSVAVSDFVSYSYKERGLPVLATIRNTMDNKIIHAQLPTWNDRFIYAGSGNLFGKGLDILQQLAKRGIDIDCFTDRPINGLKCHPPLPYNELQERYLNYCMLIFPSRYESFGFVPLEAMSAGLPILIRRTGIGIELENEIPEFILHSSGTDLINEIMEKIIVIKNDYLNFSQQAKSFSKKINNSTNFEKAWLSVLTEKPIRQKNG